MNFGTDFVVDVLFAIIIVFFSAAFLVACVIKIHGFIRQLHYINREIGRTTGREQRYWKREKRRLWLSLLPFYGK